MRKDILYRKFSPNGNVWAPCDDASPLFNAHFNLLQNAFRLISIKFIIYMRLTEIVSGPRPHTGDDERSNGLHLKAARCLFTPNGIHLKIIIPTLWLIGDEQNISLEFNKIAEMFGICNS